MGVVFFSIKASLGLSDSNTGPIHNSPAYHTHPSEINIHRVHPPCIKFTGLDHGSRHSSISGDCPCRLNKESSIVILVQPQSHEDTKILK